MRPDLGNEHKLCLPAPSPMLFYDFFLISYCSYLFSLGENCETCLRDQDDSRIVTYWDLPDPRTFGNRLVPGLLSQPNVPIYFYSLPCPYRTFLLLLAYLLTLSSACLSHVLGDQTTDCTRAGIIRVLSWWAHDLEKGVAQCTVYT